MSDEKIRACLWYDGTAEEAANFYAATFPDSRVTGVHRAPADYPEGKQGDVLTVEFTVFGMHFIGLNGGPHFKFDEAVSFQIATEDQAETDRYWNAIVDSGGKESDCGWCKDRWGLSWQITPRALTDALAAGGEEARRAFEVMMTMQKIDVAAIEVGTDVPLVTIELFAHPFSSFCWKAEIAFYEKGVAYELRTVGPGTDGSQELKRIWPLERFPVLREGDRVVPEATAIIEYLEVHHPGERQLIPSEPDAAVEVRLWDRFFDNYVSTPLSSIVFNAIRDQADRDPIGDDRARAMLDTAYAILDERMAAREWAAGEFGMADCAAAPALFYADWTHPLGDRFPNVAAYRARLLARPSVARAVDEARPYRAFFPLGAPDRD